MPRQHLDMLEWKWRTAHHTSSLRRSVASKTRWYASGGPRRTFSHPKKSAQTQTVSEWRKGKLTEAGPRQLAGPCRNSLPPKRRTGSRTPMRVELTTQDHFCPDLRWAQHCRQRNAPSGILRASSCSSRFCPSSLASSGSFRELVRPGAQAKESGVAGEDAGQATNGRTAGGRPHGQHALCSTKEGHRAAGGRPHCGRPVADGWVAVGWRPVGWDVDCQVGVATDVQLAAGGDGRTPAKRTDGATWPRCHCFE